ncbi:hypothetical protein VTK56DRAFT_8397 [Thermocarpiscus australiensis]
MHSHTLLLALAAAASAKLVPADIAARRDVAPRQTDGAGDDFGFGGGSGGSGTACADTIMSLVTAMPTPAPQLTSFFAAQTVTDACSFSIPDSLSPAFNSYTSEYSSWMADHGDDFSSALSQCPEYSSLYDGGASLPSCTQGGSDSGGNNGGDKTTDAAGSGATGSSSGSGNGNGNGSGSSSSGNAAPRETGFVGAAVAAAGFLGVVAAL